MAKKTVGRYWLALFFVHLAAGLSLCQFRGLGRKDIYRRQQQTRKLRLLLPKNVGGFKGPGVLRTIERLR